MINTIKYYNKKGNRQTNEVESKRTKQNKKCKFVLFLTD